MERVSAQMMEPWYGWLMGGLAVLAAGQQLAIYLIQQRADKREELFQIVTENAADMIALVDVKGRRLYNSPAYKRVLGYSPEELGETSAFEQIHPDDRFKVLEAAREARTTGVGGKLEYRIRHKDGTWRVLESAASTIKNPQGEVEKLVIVNRDVTERKQAQEQLEHNSFHDTLTGLPNRRLFLDRLQRLFVRAQRNPAMEYAVLFVDVDNFKIFNDMMGYAAGDQVLVEIGRRLMDCLRHDDTISRPKGKTSFVDAVLSRLGGDEFTILLDGIEDPSDALRAARRIQTSLVEPFPVAERELRISTSVGIALNTPAHRKAEDVLQDADVAMRRAKALGGSRCEVFDEAMHTRAVNRLRLETELREAIEKKQFRVYYLPMVELASKRITGFEALLRWQHPEQGLISPTKFLEAAEDTGLLVVNCLVCQRMHGVVKCQISSRMELRHEDHNHLGSKTGNKKQAMVKPATRALPRASRSPAPRSAPVPRPRSSAWNPPAPHPALAPAEKPPGSGRAGRAHEVRPPSPPRVRP